MREVRWERMFPDELEQAFAACPLVYFAYGLWRPVWGNAKGQLVGFLAYDLVLIVPFVRLWFSSPSLSLAVYIAVIAGSAVVSIWYLALSPRYRLWTRQ